MSEGGAPSGVNSAMLESMNQHTNPNVHASAGVANNEDTILGGSIEGVLGTDQIQVGLEGADIGKSILGRIKGFMSESMTKCIDAASEVIGFVKGVGQHMSDISMQPYFGQNLKAPTVPTEAQIKEVGAPITSSEGQSH
jgi:hypothetical protein